MIDQKLVDQFAKPGLKLVPAPFPERKEWSEGILGLDLGQAEDPAAGAYLVRDRKTSDFRGPLDPRCKCRALKRWPLGTSYTKISQDVIDLNPKVVVMDYGGVGRPFYDFLRQDAGRRGYQGKIIPVQTASSNARVKLKISGDKQNYIVPKAEIISAIKIMEEQGLLELPGKRVSPEAEQLLEEMRDFQTLIKRHVSMTFEHRGQGHHGDLVIALGLACWWALRHGNKQLAMVF